MRAWSAKDKIILSYWPGVVNGTKREKKENELLPFLTNNHEMAKQQNLLVTIEKSDVIVEYDLMVLENVPLKSR